MKIRCRFTVFAMAGALCATVGASSVVRADVKPNAGFARNFVGCAAVTPDATLTFAGNVPAVGQTSPAVGYSHSDGCQAFVVDFNVGVQTAQAPAGYVKEISFGAIDPVHPGYFLGLTHSQCVTYVERVSVYRKAHGAGAFTYVGGGWLRGVWS